MSSRLTSESRIYADKAKDLNRQVSFVMCGFTSNLLMEKSVCLIWVFDLLSI